MRGKVAKVLRKMAARMTNEASRMRWWKDGSRRWTGYRAAVNRVKKDYYMAKRAGRVRTGRAKK